MKKELFYLLAVYSVNLLVIAAMLFIAAWSEDKSIPVVGTMVVSLVVGTVTSSASIFVFRMWMKIENVFFITKDTVISKEYS